MTDADPIRPTSERLRHDTITIPEKDRDHQQERPARVETQTQIDRYERRRSIDESQAEAGRRYFADAYYAGTVPRAKVGGLDRVDGGSEDQSEEAVNRHIAVKTKRANAIRALGMGLVPIIEWVCVDDHSAESYAIKRKEHPRAGIALLRLGLEVLAAHYGLGQSRAA